MSQYFNSFFDPVVRQARRLSRQGDNQQHASPLRLPEGPSDGDSIVTDRTDIVGLDHTVSNNPVYGVPQSLRSTTSSLSTSAHIAVDTTIHAGPDSARDTRRNSSDMERHNIQVREGLLPADDGMGLMRKRIVAIQRTNSSSAEKARMVHELMTEQYNSSQSSLQAPHALRARSPASLASQERPFTPASLHSLEKNSTHCLSPPTPLSSVVEASDPFNLTPKDLEPTFYQKPTPGPANAEFRYRSTDRLSDDAGEDAKLLGCPHYKRNIKLQCSACYRWYTCRFCHDEVEDHSLNRRETRNMLCMLCGCAQLASEECLQCGERSARYYCSVCKLWDDDPGKSIYHCNDCGICRIGQGLGKDFYHCKVRRRRNISEQIIHHRCYYEHMKRSYRCPICSRSIVNMEMQFRHLERAIENQPMPPEFQATRASVYCNDCNQKSTVKYHWLGLKCGVCDSYNTAQLEMIHGPDQGIGQTLLPLDPQSRNRLSEISAQIRRTTNSGPSSAVVRPAHGYTDTLRDTSSAQGTESRPRNSIDGSRLIVMDEYREAMGVDSDEEYSDRNFFGLGSPRQGEALVLAGSVSSGSEDVDESDEDISQGDTDDQDDEDDMEIFGHR
ncbi:MAG: hypothetical protein LQ346_000416 [Caloplaca aetnensis]|nr:MAG: hypothetical protein LQ346_000416 [Caloplaca aetnensis]